MDAFFGNQYRNYSKVYLGFYNLQKAAEQSKEKKYSDSVALKLKPSLPLTAYLGNYFNDVYGDMSVASENGELRMKFSHHPRMYAKLESLGGNRFYVTFSDPEFGKAVFPFTVENEKVKSVMVKVADFIEYTPYNFIKK